MCYGQVTPYDVVKLGHCCVGGVGGFSKVVATFNPLGGSFSLFMAT